MFEINSRTQILDHIWKLVSWEAHFTVLTCMYAMERPLKRSWFFLFSLLELVHIEELFSVSGWLQAIFLMNSTFTFSFYIFIHF